MHCQQQRFFALHLGCSVVPQKMYSLSVMALSQQALHKFPQLLHSLVTPITDMLQVYLVIVHLNLTNLSCILAAGLALDSGPSSCKRSV